MTTCSAFAKTHGTAKGCLYTEATNARVRKCGFTEDMVNLKLANVETTGCLKMQGNTTCRCPYTGCNFDCTAHDCVKITVNGQNAEKCTAKCKNKEGIQGPYTTRQDIDASRKGTNYKSTMGTQITDNVRTTINDHLKTKITLANTKKSEIDWSWLMENIGKPEEKQTPMKDTHITSSSAIKLPSKAAQFIFKYIIITNIFYRFHRE